MIPLLIVLALLGFCISAYIYYIEYSLKRSSNYKAVCDLSDKVSCSKVLLSQYSHLLYFSNAIFGMLYYATLLVLTLYHAHFLLFLATIIGCLVSLGLAYILSTRIKTFCLLCTSLYIINILLLGTSAHLVYAS